MGTDDLLIGTADLTSTLLSLIGHKDVIPDAMQGNDYAAGLLCEEIDRPSSALYLETNPGWPEGGRRGVRTHRYTYVVERSREGDECEILHDNQEDPYQLANVAEDQSGVVSDLKGEMEGWLRKTGDPWIEN